MDMQATSNVQPSPNENLEDPMSDSMNLTPESVPLDTTNASNDRLEGQELDLALGKKRKLTSTMWSHFTREVVDGKDKAVCNYCKKKLVGGSKHGTTHLHSHYGSCMMRKCHEAKSNKQQKLVVGKTSTGKPSLVFKEYKQDVSRRELSNFVILHDHPLSIVEQVGFKRLLGSLRPEFSLVSRNTLRSDVMKIYDHEKLKMMKLLSSNDGRVGITTDMWTSQNLRRGFMVITAHWINSNWKLQSRILRFAYVPCPHTAEALCQVLNECFLDWNLDRKLSTLTLDNCSTNDCMIGLVLERLNWTDLILRGEHFHMRCCAHILNLIVKDGMDVIGSLIDTIRDSVSFWRATPKREEKFEETCRQLGITYSKKLILDCKTRWNSTYFMLQHVLIYKDVFPRLKHRDSSYKCLPSSDEWDLAKDMCDRLQLFHSVTELFSGRKYPTANLYFPKLMEIKWTLSQWMDDIDESIRNMALRMKNKFDKYWLVIHGIMGVAAMLDPRFKLMVLDVCKGEEAEKVKSICFDMFSEYEKKYSSERLIVGECDAVSSSSAHRSSSSATIVRFDDVFSQYLHPSNFANSGKSELELYFEERLHPISGEFNILEWWKTNETKYPIVSKMARDVLAIPVTTVASESAFSDSGRILDPHRSKLAPDILEALMCAKSWLWSELVDEGQSTSSVYNALSGYGGSQDIDHEY